ncbi:acyl-CoA dehydrogenase family protein [Pseudonocardia zijingensis]|uniref:Acyl-CoA dehydrogenase family protein n=1 Tax=Pseudonocardia zijingensis TaxID=153376 RepID=A0ABN1NAM2_9PSEU
MLMLDRARSRCDHHHPGLLKALTDLPLPEREAPTAPGVGLFRAHDGPGLLLPTELGGAGADPVDAVQVMRALSTCSPSLGAAATMHHFSVAALLGLIGDEVRVPPAQLDLVTRIAPENLLVASGWAEGTSGQDLLEPAVTAVPTDGGYLISGSKKPCSLARSMDLLTASVAIPGEQPPIGVIVIPADTPGISRHPFWSSQVLAGAESDEVRLTDVFVPEQLMLRTRPEDPMVMLDLQNAGFTWFQMLITSVYVGAAGALVERALARGRGSVTDRAEMIVQLESSAALVEGVARALRDGIDVDVAVAAVLTARFAAMRSLRAATDLATELLGGNAFFRDSEVALLLSATRAIAFHPPSRTGAAESLVSLHAPDAAAT